LVCPVHAWNCPNWQSLHSPPEEGWYEPGRHSEHATDPTTAYVPSAHVSHATALYVVENFPAGHSSQTYSVALASVPLVSISVPMKKVRILPGRHAGVGAAVGAAVGDTVGACVGLWVGSAVGVADGDGVGMFVGIVAHSAQISKAAPVASSSRRPSKGDW
jgi:hypothetical protein